jgi:hypothetical protein
MRETCVANSYFIPEIPTIYTFVKNINLFFVVTFGFLEKFSWTFVYLLFNRSLDGDIFYEFYQAIWIRKDYYGSGSSTKFRLRIRNTAYLLLVPFSVSGDSPLAEKKPKSLDCLKIPALWIRVGPRCLLRARICKKIYGCQEPRRNRVVVPARLLT